MEEKETQPKSQEFLSTKFLAFFFSKNFYKIKNSPVHSGRLFHNIKLTLFQLLYIQFS